MVEWLKKHWVWVAGGVLLLVAFIWLRNRQAGGATEEAAGGGGFAGGGGASAPATDTTAQNQQSALDQLEIQQKQGQLSFSNAMNDLYLQGEKLRLQFGQNTLQSSSDLQNQINLTNAAHEKQLGKASADYCPAGTSMRLDPNTGQYVCRNKSGGFSIIGQVFSGVQNILSGFTSGAAAAAPAAGAGFVQGAANYYGARLFSPPGTVVPTQGYGNQVGTKPDYYHFGQMSGGYTPAPSNVTGISGDTVRIA